LKRLTDVYILTSRGRTASEKRQVSRSICCDPMSALGHVWTAPWQELSDGLQHWSGAVTCPAYWCGRYGRWP